MHRGGKGLRRTGTIGPKVGQGPLRSASFDDRTLNKHLLIATARNSPVKIIKEGGHRLFENDPETARYVSELLERLRRDGMDAVRALSSQFDEWSPASFELSEPQIADAVAQCPPELRQDTDFCQGNVRRFAQEQFKMFRPLEVEGPAGVWLGHKHIPVATVGSYVPGGRYPRCSARRR